MPVLMDDCLIIIPFQCTLQSRFCRPRICGGTPSQFVNLCNDQSFLLERACQYFSGRLSKSEQLVRAYSNCGPIDPREHKAAGLWAGFTCLHSFTCVTSHMNQSMVAISVLFCSRSHGNAHRRKFKPQNP